MLAVSLQGQHKDTCGLSLKETKAQQRNNNNFMISQIYKHTNYFMHFRQDFLLVGNLALSRALGDFVFKKNETKKPEDQIVTGI